MIAKQASFEFCVDIIKISKVTLRRKFFKYLPVPKI